MRFYEENIKIIIVLNSAEWSSTHKTPNFQSSFLSIFSVVVYFALSFNTIYLILGKRVCLVPYILKKVLSKLSEHCKIVVKKYLKICLCMYQFLFWRIFLKYHTAGAIFNDFFSVWLHKQSLTICLHNVVEQLLMFLLSSLSKCWATAISNTLSRSWALYLILIHGPQTHS